MLAVNLYLVCFDQYRFKAKHSLYVHFEYLTQKHFMHRLDVTCLQYSPPMLPHFFPAVNQHLLSVLQFLLKYEEVLGLIVREFYI